MKDRLKKLLAKAKPFASHLKQTFTHFATFVHTTVRTVAGGGAVAVATEWQKTGKIPTTIEHLIELKAQFVAGCVVTFVAYLLQFKGKTPTLADALQTSAASASK